MKKLSKFLAVAAVAAASLGGVSSVTVATASADTGGTPLYDTYVDYSTGAVVQVGLTVAQLSSALPTNASAQVNGNTVFMHKAPGAWGAVDVTVIPRTGHPASYHLNSYQVQYMVAHPYWWTYSQQGSQYGLVY